ncbi:MAG: hypothetical protein LBL46_03195 [Rickettsiales bacterium]|jgi:hypothetical protein|nr:hypothetical protein [Rickettsiales bacterium]
MNKHLFEVLKAHMGKEPKFIRRVFNRTGKLGALTDKYFFVPVVQNYTLIKGDEVRKTCFACMIRGQCTPYAMSHSHMCERFNMPAVARVTIPQKECAGCKWDTDRELDDARMIDAVYDCSTCKVEGKGYKIRHSGNISFYIQENAGLGAPMERDGSWENPQVCERCGQLDVKGQQEWLLRKRQSAKEENDMLLAGVTRSRSL